MTKSSAGLRVGDYVRLNLNTWKRSHCCSETVERAARAGMLGRVYESFSDSGACSVKWLNPPLKTWFSTSYGTFDFFIKVTPLEMLAMAQIMEVEPSEV